MLFCNNFPWKGHLQQRKQYWSSWPQPHERVKIPSAIQKCTPLTQTRRSEWWLVGQKQNTLRREGPGPWGKENLFLNYESRLSFIFFQFLTIMFFGNLCHKISRLTSRPERDNVEKVREFSRGQKMIFFNRCYQGSSRKYHYFLENMAISE